MTRLTHRCWYLLGRFAPAQGLADKVEQRVQAATQILLPQVKHEISGSLQLGHPALVEQCRICAFAGMDINQ